MSWRPKRGGGAASGRMNADKERAAWTALVEGTEAKPEQKYHSKRAGKYASSREAKTAVKLWALQEAGQITDLREQVRITLVPGDGKVRGVVYIADFVYRDLDGREHVLDSKGFKTETYLVKKRLAWLLLGIEIEED